MLAEHNSSVASQNDWHSLYWRDAVRDLALNSTIFDCHIGECDEDDWRVRVHRGMAAYTWEKKLEAGRAQLTRSKKETKIVTRKD